MKKFLCQFGYGLSLIIAILSVVYISDIIVRDIVIGADVALSWSFIQLNQKENENNN